jgi:DNA polymerase-3 subunit alpha
VRNVGGNVVDAVVAARDAKGAYADFRDFLDKVPAPVCNKRTVESLVAAGAFDALGHTRRSLTAVLEEAVDEAVALKRKQADGQFDLFAGLAGDGDDAGVATGVSTVVPDLPEWDKKELLARERSMLGLYVSDHPLSGIEGVLARLADVSIGQLATDETLRDRAKVTVAGLVTGVQRKISKQGKTWAIVTLEDLAGSVEVLVFPSQYEIAGPVLAEDVVVVVKGDLSRSDDRPVSVRATEITLPDVETGVDGPVTIQMDVTRCTPVVVERLKTVLDTHPGTTEVRLQLRQPGRDTLMRLDDGLRVTVTPALFGDLKALLGPACLG